MDQPLGHTDNLTVGISRFYIKTYTIIDCTISQYNIGYVKWWEEDDLFRGKLCTGVIQRDYL